jgi:nitrite reductase (NO-forming)
MSEAAASAGGAPRRGGEGAAGRVAAVHRQTRRGLAVAAGFLVAAVVCAAVPHDTGVWLPLHLFLVGALLSAISAVSQMLAVTWSASRPAGDSAAGVQRYGLALGAALLAIGREARATWLTLAGGVLVMAAVVLLIALLLGIRGGAVTDRFAPAIDGYVVALTAGLAGMAMGALLVKGASGQRWVDVRAAHLTVNLFGLVGLVIAATVPYFAATQARMKMSPLATPRTIRLAVAVLAVAVTVATLGRATGHRQIAAIALAVYAAGLGGILLLCPRPKRKQFSWAGARLVQLAAGLVWWMAMTALLAVRVWRGAGEQHVLESLIVGGFAPILLSSLAYLGPVLRGGGHELLTAGFTTTRSWLGLVAGVTAAIAALAGQERVLYGATVVWLADTAVRGLRLQKTLDN